MAKWIFIQVEEPLWQVIELWYKFLHVQSRSHTAIATRCNINKQKVRTIEMSGLQLNVHGHKRLLAHQIMKYNTWR